MGLEIAIILTDAEKKIIWVNEGFTSITGYSLSEVIGRKPNLLQGPASEKEAISRIRKGLQHKVPLQEQITNYRKNGEKYLCKLVIHPIFNKNQELTNYIAFEVDGDKDEKEEKEISLLRLKEKYSSSSLKMAEELKLFSKLKELLEKEKIYLHPNLTLQEVSDMLKTNPKYLSQAVNHQAGENFQHYINTFRVEEVKNKINDDQYRLLDFFGIARLCGFKNKSTFYKVFKEITGTTPRRFLKTNA